MFLELMIYILKPNKNNLKQNMVLVILFGRGEFNH